MELTPEQHAAVTRKGQDVCVVAGPGSGKTRVLVERFRWRVEQGLSPSRILAVTFTEKAATQLKQRLAAYFLAQPELREELERAHVSTLHGFCARLLREHAIEAGLDPQFEMLEGPEAAAERRAAAEETLDALLVERPEAVRALLLAVDVHDPADALAGVYEARRLLAPEGRRTAPAAGFDAAFAALRESLREIAAASPQGWNLNQQAHLGQVQDWARRVLALPPDAPLLEHFRPLSDFDCNLTRLKRNNPLYERVKLVKQELLPAARQALATAYYAPQRALLEEALDRLEARYRQRKLAVAALDFADLEEHAIRLLGEDERLRQRVRQSFDEILMDELQDTNPLQAALIQRIRRPGRFFAVGDINQSIYGFRHAEPEVFKSYRRELESQGLAVDRLRQNHRSRADILAAAEGILDGAAGIERQDLIAAGRFAPKQAPSVEVIAAVAVTTEEAARLEAQWVARRIRELTGNGGVRFSEVAVLVRNVNALEAFEEAFHDFDVPYVIARGKGFYEAQEVADLTHWLRVLANPRDEISLAAALRSPLAGVSDETQLRLKQAGNLSDALSRFEEGAIDAGDLERLGEFRERLRAARAEVDDVPPELLLVRIIDAVDYESGLGVRARANVRKFLELVRGWHHRRPRPLAQLVRDLEDRRAADPDEAAAPLEGAVNAVQVMTIHAAKGLEFPVVFVAALHKGVANDSPPLAFSPTAGLVARWRDPASGERVKDRPYTLFSEELKRKEHEEEDRLFYVAMTRAIDHLVLSFAAGPKGARNWAGTVIERLGLDLNASGGQPVVRSYPAGAKEFRARILCAWEPPERPAARAPEQLVTREERLARPAMPGQHDSSASVTDLWMFQQCPRKYFLQRYLGWEQPSAEPRPPSEPRPSGSGHPGAAELGRQVHDLLAGSPVEGAAAEARALASRFQAGELGRRAARALRAGREFDFLLDLEDMVLQGRIDLWFEEGGELVLVDFKTDDVAGADAAERARSYALQLQLYALALERLAGRLPDRALICLLRPDVEAAVSLRPEDLEAARTAVRALRHAQQNMHFPPRIGVHCSRCACFRALCPARAAAGG